MGLAWPLQWQVTYCSPVKGHGPCCSPMKGPGCTLLRVLDPFPAFGCSGSEVLGMVHAGKLTQYWFTILPGWDPAGMATPARSTLPREQRLLVRRYPNPFTHTFLESPFIILSDHGLGGGFLCFWGGVFGVKKPFKSHIAVRFWPGGGGGQWCTHTTPQV